MVLKDAVPSTTSMKRVSVGLLSNIPRKEGSHPTWAVDGTLKEP